jgi:hypothetical protein
MRDREAFWILLLMAIGLITLAVTMALQIYEMVREGILPLY